jgi:PAS domain S-box-containing protein
MAPAGNIESGRAAGSVLIVDDTPENLAVLAQVLRNHGYRVRSVLNGRLALQTAERAPPDLVLLDVWMPEMDGYEVCRRFKADERLKAIPIIFISATTDTGIKVKAFTSGGVDFIAKPFEAEEVLARVGTHLALASVERELERRLTERTEDLRRASLYARSLIEATLDPLVTISPEGRITDVNRATEDATGLTRAALIGTEVAESFTEPEMARAGYRRVLAEGSIRDYPLTIRHRSGSTLDVLYNATLYHDEKGEVQGVLAAARDITERKRAEEAVRVSERRYRRLFESAKDGILVLDLESGRVLDVNPALTGLLGCDRDDVIGRTLSGLEDVFAAGIGESLCCGLREQGQVHYPDLPVTTRDGRQLWVEFVGSRYRVDHEQVTQCNIRDVTERVLAEKALRRTNRALKTITSCNGVLVHATDEGQLLADMCRIIVEIGGYRLAWIGMVDGTGQELRPVAQLADGAVRNGDEGAVVGPWGDGVLGLGLLDGVVRTGVLRVVQDAATDPDFAPWRAGAAALGYASVLVLPLASGGRVFGVLSIHSAEAHAFDDGEVRLLAELGEDLGYGLSALRTRDEHERTLQRLEASMEATVQAIAGTVEMRDPYTAGHQYRVAQLAVAIALELGMAESEVHGLYLASIVHDLGKIHIPAEILSKPGRLSRIEYELIQTHAAAGFDLLKVVDFPWPIAQIVSQHHERLDGSGYPEGLTGDKILLDARIVAVADVVEAMASHRPYRPALGIARALAEIEQNQGRLYDPQVVAACLRLFRDRGFAFR